MTALGPYEHTGAYRPDALAQPEQTRVYMRAGDVAHLLGELDSPNSYARCVRCKRAPRAFGTPWYGTGSQREREKAAALPLCGEGYKRVRSGRRREHGGLGLGIAIVVAGIGLFLFGLVNSGRHPDMRVVGSCAIVGALVLFIGVCISGYRRRERQGASSATKSTKGLQQDTSGEHYWDGA